MNINEIRKAAKVVETAAENEKAGRILDVVCRKACQYAKGWLLNETSHLEADIRDFFTDTPCREALKGGVAVFFGRNDYMTKSTKDYGAYVVSLEESLPGSKFPYVMKINIRAQARMAKFIAKRLGVDKEILNATGIEELLTFEKDGHLLFRFVGVDELPDFGEVIELGKLETRRDRDPVPVTVYLSAVVNDGEILVNRSDWYAGAKYSRPFDYDLWHVHVPKAEAEATA